MNDVVLRLEGVKKRFGETEVLNGVDLKVVRGEFVTLLGPSGCGKTTTLRVISGLEHPDAGRVVLEGADVTGVPPNKRDVNTVFQNYALFPHMSVEANIGYSLRIRRAGKRDIREAVAQALALVQLEGYEKRMPHELSGGQKQRIAIARAIVNKPKLLLLDEPLGALDLQLRRQMQVELKRLQRQLGITFIYITHDQEEALNMSSRVAVMRGGRFEQIGPPSDVYDFPRTAFVASFVGNANIIRGFAAETGSETILIRTPHGGVRVCSRGAALKNGQAVAVAVRSEQMSAKKAAGTPREGLSGVVKEKSFAAGMLRIAVETADKSELIVSRHGINTDLNEGDPVVLSWDPQSAVLVDAEENNV